MKRSRTQSGDNDDENDFPKTPRLETTESDSLSLFSNPDRLQFIFQLFEITKQRLFTSTRLHSKKNQNETEEIEKEELHLEPKPLRIWLKPRLENANHWLTKLPLKIQFCIFEYLDQLDRYQLSLVCVFYQNCIGVFEMLKMPKSYPSLLKISDEENELNTQKLIEKLDLWGRCCLNPTFDSFNLEESNWKEEGELIWNPCFRDQKHVMWEEKKEDGSFLRLGELHDQMDLTDDFIF